MNSKTAQRCLEIRFFEETLLRLFSEGKLSGTVHTCIGQELSAVVVADQLRPGDWVFSNHRCHGHYLARYGDVPGLLAEIMGLPSGICGGRGGSQHVCHQTFLSNGVQGGGVPIAAGCAATLKAVPETPMAVAFIGDGTLGQGVVYETLNLASKWEVPLLIVLENNGYAQSTSSRQTLAGSIPDRFRAFGFKCGEGNIWEEEALRAVARETVAHVRATGKPAVLVIDCFRLRAHSKGDDNRAREEIRLHEDRDPLNRFLAENEVEAQALREFCRAHFGAIETRLLAESALAPARTPIPAQKSILDWRPVAEPGGKVVDRIRAGLHQMLATDATVHLLGEDLEDPYGGAFKATKGLSDAFPGRVRNTPISEAAIVGFATGMALAGRRPVVEIMFGDFITLAADQLINQASKFNYMYNGQVKVPIIVRTPMGGKRGYGATHSQSLEKHFLGLPGLRVLAINSIWDPLELYRRLHTSVEEPCLVVENKQLYGAAVRGEAADGRRWQASNELFPTLKLSARNPDLTIVGYGGMAGDMERAARNLFVEHEITCELIIATQLFPLNVTPISESLSRTGRLLVVEEGQGFAGFGGEVLAQCAEAAGGAPFKYARVSASPHPIPCARSLELQALPGDAEVLAAALNLCQA